MVYSSSCIYLLGCYLDAVYLGALASSSSSSSPPGDRATGLSHLLPAVLLIHRFVAAARSLSHSLRRPNPKKMTC